MLTSRLIMYSRSLSNDYRWIFFDERLSESDKDLFSKSYSMFENDKEYYLKNQHLIMQKSKEHVFFYSFINTGNYDQNSREIYALIGYCFSGFDLELINKLYNYVVPFLFYKSNSLIELVKNITDTQENDNKIIEISLDEVIYKYKEDKLMSKFSKNIYEFLENNSNVGYIATSEKIVSLEIRDSAYKKEPGVSVSPTPTSFCLEIPVKSSKQEFKHIKNCSLIKLAKKIKASK